LYFVAYLPSKKIGIFEGLLSGRKTI